MHLRARSCFLRCIFHEACWVGKILTLFFLPSVLRCKDPGSIENGEMEGSPPFTCVSIVKNTCNEDYWLLGAETLRCGIDGQWDYGKPVCIDKSKKYREKFLVEY